MAGQENYRDNLRQAALHHCFEQSQSTHARHAHIEQNTAWLRLHIARTQHLVEGLSTVEGLTGQVARAQ